MAPSRFILALFLLDVNLYSLLHELRQARVHFVEVCSSFGLDWS